jgi:hypothetical protein
VTVVALEPDGLEAVRRLTQSQRNRLRKKLRSMRAKNPDAAYVTCEGCGWTGFDIHLRHDPDVTPCPRCGHVYARLAAPPSEGPWWT